MTAPAATAPTPIHRDAVTWYCYLLLGYITFAFNLQGNILPFLKAELDLSYRLVSLHSSAMAAGMIAIGFAAPWIMRNLSRRRGLWLATAGIMAGLTMLATAPDVYFSIAGCVLIGGIGSLIPAIAYAVLADGQRDHRDVAISESNVVSYALAIFAPLTMGAALSLGLGWRVPVLLGVVGGGIIVLAFRSAPFPRRSDAAAGNAGGLPATFWAYLCLLAAAVSVEFGMILWAPAFLEQVVGLDRASAAAASAAFLLAMLLGRASGTYLVRSVPPATLLAGSLAVAAVGFAAYWGGSGAWIAVPGLFVTGLGVALLFPMTLSLAVAAAGPREEAASARIPLAGGVALFVAPAALGWAADLAGLATALLAIPGLIGAACVCLAVARALQRRPAVAA